MAIGRVCVLWFPPRLRSALVRQILVQLLVLACDPGLAAAARMQQCLTVFFHAYAPQSVTAQERLCMAALPAGRRALSAGASSVKSAAPQLLRYVLSLLQVRAALPDNHLLSQSFLHSKSGTFRLLMIQRTADMMAHYGSSSRRGKSNHLIKICLNWRIVMSFTTEEKQHGISDRRDRVSVVCCRWMSRAASRSRGSPAAARGTSAWWRLP